MIPEPEFMPYDSPLRWEIKSKTKSSDGTYLVDLGRPECQCRWFVCEVAPKLKMGLRPTKMCSHIITAKQRFTEWSIWNEAQRDPNKSHDDEQL